MRDDNYKYYININILYPLYVTVENNGSGHQVSEWVSERMTYRDATHLKIYETGFNTLGSSSELELEDGQRMLNSPRGPKAKFFS